MADNKNSCRATNADSACIDCNRILDSCRDKDCFEDTRCYLTSLGQEIIQNTSNIRIKDTKVVWTDLSVEPVAFNRGFYNITIRFYTKITCEACIGPAQAQEFEGICVCEKHIILYGSEGNVNIFKSTANPDSDCCTSTYTDSATTNAPTVVCEVTDPIALGIKVECRHNGCGCCCSPKDIPARLCKLFSTPLADSENTQKNLYVTLGFFSVVRVERPCQYIINCKEYTVPDKVCIEAGDDDPCSAFAKMSFPLNEFYPPSYTDNGNCGCK